MKKKKITNNADSANLSKIAKIIKQSKTFFIAGHVKPDGDSLGSALALYSMLKRAGKKPEVYCADEVPSFLKFLSGSKQIKKSVKKNKVFDCAIILESINFSRMGDLIAPNQAKKIINIDHHSMFTNFGDVNYIVPTSSSTAELILKIFEHMKIKPSKNEAECLYTGLVTDTGRFQQLNTTQDSHLAAAKFIGCGVSPNDVFQKVYVNNSLQGLKLLGMALAGIKTAFDGRFVYMKVTKKMFRESGAGEDETEPIINFTMSVKGVKVGCLFKEVGKNTIKVSFRSVKDFNILDIVRKCGGGGHKNAAGCTIKADFDTAFKMISGVFKEKFNGKPK